MDSSILLATPPSLHSAPPVTEFRSTVIQASLASLRARGLLDDYVKHLAPEYHETVLDTVVGTWLPIRIASAHYSACDALRLTPAAIVQIGKEDGAKVQNTVLHTIIGLAQKAGVTPWTVLGHYDRLAQRLWRGGAVVVWKLGPKEARVEIHKNPLMRIPYFRSAFLGGNQAGALLFARTIYVREERKDGKDDALIMRAQWV